MLDLRNQGVKLKNNKFNQHFTSDNISIFMANSISIPSERKRITLLDPGAGNGVLSIALVKQIIRKYGNIKNIKIVDTKADATKTCRLPYLSAIFPVICAVIMALSPPQR